MRLRFVSIATVVLMCGALSGQPAGAVVENLVAGPGVRTTGLFTTPLVLAPVGGPVTFTNQDIQPHGVASDAYGPGAQPWCGFFAEGKCPLLWAPVTDAGGRNSQVQGLANTVSGTQYGLHCTLHANMRATLLVL
jgi:plastocyanin